MDKDQTLHDVALAYILYTNLTDKPIDPDSFYQDYKRATYEFDKLIDHYKD